MRKLRRDQSHHILRKALPQAGCPRLLLAPCSTSQHPVLYSPEQMPHLHLRNFLPQHPFIPLPPKHPPKLPAESSPGCPQSSTSAPAFHSSTTTSPESPPPVFPLCCLWQHSAAIVSTLLPSSRTQTRGTTSRPMAAMDGPAPRDQRTGNG